MKKNKVIETINSLPAEFSLEDLIDRLIFIDKVEQGLIEVEEGKTKTNDEVKEASSKWGK